MVFRTKQSIVALLLLLSAGATANSSAQVINKKGASAYTVGTFVPDGLLRSPSSVAVDASGNVYVVDAGNFVVRKFTSSGVGQVLAGVDGDNQKAEEQHVAKADRVKGVCYTKTGDHCTSTQAVLSSPRDIVLDQAGNVYISDISAGKIRKMDIKTGVVTTYAGGNGGGWSATQLHAPSGMAFDSKGNLYVADKMNNAVRMIAPPIKPAKKGTITTIAGLGPDQPGCSTDGAVAVTSMLTRPQDIAVDASGNIYIADTGCRKIRMISTDGTITTVVGTGANHVGTPPEVPFIAASGKAVETNLANPTSITLDKAGNLLVSDPGFDLVWYYNAAVGTVQVFAGLAQQASICNTSRNPQGDGCNGDGAFLNVPGKPAIDSVGNIYIPEQGGTKSPTHPFDVRILRSTNP